MKGISEAKVLKLKEIVKAMVPMDFKTAADALEDRKCVGSFFHIVMTDDSFIMRYMTWQYLTSPILYVYHLL